MDSIVPGAITFICACGAVIAFTMMRRSMRPPKRHWFTRVALAVVFAVVLAGAFAASVFYLGQTQKVLIATLTAFVATCAIHVGLAALFIYLVPIERRAHASEDYRNQSRRVDRVAA